MAKRILFIGHEASRTGAPIVLLNLLRWFKANCTEFDIDLLLLKGGPLTDDYREVSNVFVLPEARFRLFGRLKRKLGFSQRLITSGLAPFERDYDVIFGNTIVTARYLKFFKERGSRTICWVHELKSTLKAFWPESEFRELARFVDAFMVVSKAVGEMLEMIGVTACTHLIHPFLPREPKDTGDNNAVRKKLGIPEGAFVVGGSGSIETRKGVDLFVKIASNLSASYDNFYFVWVGGRSIHESRTYNLIQQMVKDSALSGRVIITGIQEYPLQYFATFDLFALTSREEPFGLVGLEAASMGKPIICFDGTGGAPEYVKDCCGFAVPYLDTSAFSEKIVELFSNPELRNELGTNASERAHSEFSIEKSVRKILKIIDGSVEN
jgi:glycosyltransferase involved in cell wall biosynthesis